MTMTFDPASFRTWQAQLTMIRRPPGARGRVATALGWAAYALVWLIALGVVIGVPLALVAVAMRLAMG
jgi:hypothetical protein